MLNKVFLHRKATVALLSGVMALGLLATGCGDKTKSQVATESDAKATEATATEAPTAAPTKAPEITAEPTPTPELSFEEAWKYEIVLDGYYNAAAKWDEDGKLVKNPAYKAGQNIYYNDCDEYYNNFVSDTNVYGGTQLTLDDEYAHSSDNSVKITSRKANTKGFSGFALNISKDNALKISKLQGKEITLGLWVYYNDSFSMGVPEELDFAIWSNLNPEEDEANEAKTPEPTYDEPTDEMTAEEKQDLKDANQALKDTYERFKAQEEKANKEGFYKLATKKVAYENWTYIEVTTKVNTEAENPCLVLATLGEANNDNVTFYNPFYVDDIYLKLNN